MKYHCKEYFNHEPEQKCESCKLEVDKYGNTEADRLNCSFPDCGCDGARLCDAPSGANENANGYNVEGMWNQSSSSAKKARIKFVEFIHKKKSPSEGSGE